jgi:hypothetical protein
MSVDNASAFDPAFAGIPVRRGCSEPAQHGTSNDRGTNPAVPMVVMVAMPVPVLGHRRPARR